MKDLQTSGTKYKIFQVLFHTDTYTCCSKAHRNKDRFHTLSIDTYSKEDCGTRRWMTNLTFRGLFIVMYSYNESQRDALFLKFILIKNSTCFRQIYCPSSEVSTLYSQQ